MTESTAYAVCNDCETELPTQADATQHGHETLAAVEGEGAVSRRGHSMRIINPTAEQQNRWRVARFVDDALTRFIDDMDEQVQRGHLSDEQVREGLREYPDFADAWDNFLSEEGR